jgi:RHS repeat-associated protein
LDPQGNRTLLVDPDNKRTVYGYDELNRLETLTLDDQQSVIYEYFPDGLKKTVTNPNGTVSTYLYDAADRMDTITHVGPTGTISSYAYFYDANSNRERQVETNAGRTETTEYTYDFVNRLKTVTYPDRTTRYEYDQAGNRIQEVTTGAEASDETFHYDAINRLERITDTVTGAELTRYAYDANGNTTSKTKGGITTTFHYDIRDQLGEVRQGPSILGRYGYDYNGRRILKIGDDGRKQYTYDQLSVVTEADQVNSTVSKYDYGMDQLVRLDNRNEGRSFFHLDGLRSTVGLTDSAGGSRQSIFYDAWGNERDRIGSSANNFTFTGHELDEETGLIYAKARFYDPEIGRFLTQDSVVGDASTAPSLHRYVYSWNRPTFFFDADGHEVLPVGCYTGGECVSPPTEPTHLDKSIGGAIVGAAEFALDVVLAFPRLLVWGQELENRGPGAELVAMLEIGEAVDTSIRERVHYSKLALEHPEAAAEAINELGPYESTRMMTRTTLEVTGTVAAAAETAGAIRAAMPSRLAGVGSAEAVTVVESQSGSRLMSASRPQGTATSTTWPQGVGPSAESSTLPGGLRPSATSTTWSQGAQPSTSSSSAQVASGAALSTATTGSAAKAPVGTQNPATAWAAKTGRAYDRRVTRFWRQYEGKTVGGWTVESVNRRLAPGVQPDVVLVNDATKTIVIHDVTSKAASSHLTKGAGYKTFFEAQRPGYTVKYSEGYWEGLENSWEALTRQGDLYFPGATKPK